MQAYHEDLKRGRVGCGFLATFRHSFLPAPGDSPSPQSEILALEFYLDVVHKPRYITMFQILRIVLIPSFFPVGKNMVPGALPNLGGPLKSSDEAREVLMKIEYKDGDLESFKSSLSYLARESPIEVYAIALDLLRARCGGEGAPTMIIGDISRIAMSAARNCLSLPFPSPGVTMADQDRKRLVSYRCQCRDRLHDVLNSEGLTESTGTEWIWYNPECGVCPLVPESIVMPDAAPGMKIYPTKWWAAHWETIVRDLWNFPCEKAIEDQNIWDSTLQALAEECPECHKAAAEEFPLFRERLVTTVAKIIDGVSIPFVGCCVCKGLTLHPTRSSWSLIFLV